MHHHPISDAVSLKLGPIIYTYSKFPSGADATDWERSSDNTDLQFCGGDVEGGVHDVSY